MSHTKAWVAILAVVVGLSLAGAAQAASIGVQYVAGGTTPLLAADSAGVSGVAQINWNAIDGSSFSSVALNDNAGTATTATLSGSAAGPYFSGSLFPNGTGDKKLTARELYNGYPTTNSTTVSGIPYATYDVYVYACSDAAGRNVTFALTPSGGSALYKSLLSTSTASTWIESTDTWDGTGTPPTLPVADYVRFTGLTASSYTLKFGSPSNGAMNGFQIVQVPEPATMALLALGGIGMLVSRKRRK